MPRRHYDLDEVLALAESGKVAAQIVEELGLSVGERAIQKTVNKFLGPRPARPVADDGLRRRVVAWTLTSGLDDHLCYSCGRWSANPCLIRELERDGTLAFVGRCCSRAADD